MNQPAPRRAVEQLHSAEAIRSRRSSAARILDRCPQL